jgi:hypothetical protein
MIIRRERVRDFAATTLAVNLCLTGCSDEQLRQYVEKFDKSVQSASSAVRQKYMGINDLRRAAYLTQVRLKPGTKVESKVEVNGQMESTGLVQYYSDEFIETRLVAFQALASYTEGLALMAASDSPARAEQALKVTGERVNQLSAKLASLNPEAKSVNLTQFATPVSRLAGIATRQLLEYLKDKNLKESLAESESAVHELSKMLIDDLNEINTVAEGAEWASILAHYRALYNDNSQFLNGTYLDGGRTTILKDIEQVAKRYADLNSTNPSRLVVNIQLAHDQVIDYLNTNKKKRSAEDLGNLLDADLRQFETDARLVSESANRIAGAYQQRQKSDD